MTAPREKWLLAALGLTALAVACQPEISKPGHAGDQTTVARKATNADAGAGDAGPPMVSFQESEFTENDRSRDPFRAYASMFAEEVKTRTHGGEKPVILRQYSLDELKLIGIVTRVHPAVAMLVDPTGKGHVIHRGQFVGRAEVVQAGTGTASYEVNWRVDRIREGDVVLVREDPSNPDVPTATRVIPLRPAGESTGMEEGSSADAGSP